MKQKNWHKSSQKQISAPLILDPVEGEMTNEIKAVCKKFEEVTGFRVAAQTKARWESKQTISEVRTLKGEEMQT